jgi:hypothetical protein
LTFIALMAGSICGVLGAFAFVHWRFLSGANSRSRVANLTWAVLLVTLLPNWFISVVGAGTLGGGVGGSLGELLGGSQEAFVALGIMGGMAVYLFSTMTLLALVSLTVGTRFIRQ